MNEKMPLKDIAAMETSSVNASFDPDQRQAEKDWNDYLEHSRQTQGVLDKNGKVRNTEGTYKKTESDQEYRNRLQEESLEATSRESMGLVSLAKAARAARESGDKTTQLNIEDEIQDRLIATAQEKGWSSEQTDGMLKRLLDVMHADSNSLNNAEASEQVASEEVTVNDPSESVAESTEVSSEEDVIALPGPAESVAPVVNSNHRVPDNMALVPIESEDIAEGENPVDKYISDFDDLVQKGRQARQDGDGKAWDSIGKEAIARAKNLPLTDAQIYELLGRLEAAASENDEEDADKDSESGEGDGDTDADSWDDLDGDSELSVASSEVLDESEDVLRFARALEEIDPGFYSKWASARNKYVVDQARSRGATVPSSEEEGGVKSRLRKLFNRKKSQHESNSLQFSQLNEEAFDKVRNSLGHLSSVELNERMVDLKADAAYGLDWDISTLKLESASENELTLSRILAMLGTAAALGATTAIVERMQNNNDDHWSLLAMAGLSGAFAGVFFADKYKAEYDEGMRLQNAKAALGSVIIDRDNNLSEKSIDVLKGVEDNTKREGRQEIRRRVGSAVVGGLVGTGAHWLIDAIPALRELDGSTLPGNDTLQTDPVIDNGIDATPTIEATPDAVATTETPTDITGQGDGNGGEEPVEAGYLGGIDTTIETIPEALDVNVGPGDGVSNILMEYGDLTPDQAGDLYLELEKEFGNGMLNDVTWYREAGELRIRDTGQAEIPGEVRAYIDDWIATNVKK